MVRFHPTRSAIILSAALALSVLLYFIGLVIPLRLSDWYGGVLYLLTGVLIAAVIDHGHISAAGPQRWRRFSVSVVAILAWFIAGAGMVSLYSGAALSFGQTAGQVWSTLWPMIVMAVAMAILGMGLARLAERHARTVDAAGLKAYH